LRSSSFSLDTVAKHIKCIYLVMRIKTGHALLSLYYLL
jgi:hypothetical protein